MNTRNTNHNKNMIFLFAARPGLSQNSRWLHCVYVSDRYLGVWPYHSLCLNGLLPHREVHTLLILTEIVAACEEYFPVYGFIFCWKRCVWLTVEHGRVIRKWLHPIPAQLHWAHDSYREAKITSSYFHFGNTVIVCCFWSSQQFSPTF